MPCLSDQSLHDFHACELGEAESERVASHLALCPGCAARDAALVREHERLVELVIQALPAGLPAADAGRRVNGPIPAAEKGNGRLHLPPSSGRLPEIPGYDVLREIHRGGQGIVFEAIQRSTRRRVAIKVMRDGPFAGPRDHARFEREVRILAQLNHPNIVAIHDSGVAGDCFYSVMDFVSGRPLDEYVQSRKSKVESRNDKDADQEILELFTRICEAVNAAHQLGVIHRDLKPGNILVSDDGRPFILDFGLAKMTQITGGTAGPHITGETPVPHLYTMTQTGQFLGSLPWASPEQAQGDTQLDVRTDVYSIGVMLYHALTGRFPYPVTGSLGEILDQIRHRQPPRPSQVRRELNDEIDTIVLRCLAKERERRYQSAGELARDLEHYLRGEPIEAKRDRGLYVLRKTLWRHKAVTALSGVLVVSLTAFGVAMAVQSVRLAHSRDAALESRAAAETQRDLARTEKRRADAESQRNARLAYASQIALAQRHLDVSAIAEMRRVLDATNPEARGWEWYRLQWLSDRSDRRISAGGITTRAVVTCEGEILWGTDSGKIHCRKAADPQASYSVRIDDSPVSTLALSQDQETLHAGNGRGRFTLRTRTGELLAASYDHGVQTLHPWTGSKLLEVAAWPDVNVSLIDLDSGSSLFTIPWKAGWDFPHGMDRAVLAVRPDQNHSFALAVGPSAWLGTIKGNYSRSYREPEQGVKAVAYSPDGRHLALTAGTGLIRIWDTTQHQPVRTLSGHSHPVTALQYSHDGTRLVSGDGDGGIRLWDVRTADCLRVFHGHTNTLLSVVFSADDRTIVSASRDETIRVWNTADVETVRVVRAAGAGYASFSPDCRRVAVADGAGLTVCRRDGSGVKKFSGEAEASVCGFFPDGGRAYLADREGGVHIWRVATGEKLAALRHKAGVPAAACSPDGRFLVTGSWDGTCRIWNGSDLRPRHTLRHSAEVWDLAISNDSRLLAAGTQDGTAWLWDLESGRPLRQWTGHGAEVDALAFAPDDRHLAVGCWGGRVRIYDLGSGLPVAEGKSPHKNIYSAAFTPDGRRLLLGTRGYVELLDPRTGELVHSFSAHEGSVFSLQLSRNARMLLTSGGDSSFKIWPAMVPPATQPARK